MTTGRIEMGSTAQRVAANLRRLRETRGMSLRALSAEVQKMGRTLSADAINKIENGRLLEAEEVSPKQVRRADVDDLVALALALNVSPNALLLPPTWDDSPVPLAGVVEVTARTAWMWAEGRSPANDWGSGKVEVEVDTEESEAAEEEFWRQRREYLALTLPPERLRAAEHQANAAASDLSKAVNRLVQMDQAGNKDAARQQLRITKNRLDRLRNAIEEIELELNGQDD